MSLYHIPVTLFIAKSSQHPQFHIINFENARSPNLATGRSI